MVALRIFEVGMQEYGTWYDICEVDIYWLTYIAGKMLDEKFVSRKDIFVLNR